MIGIWKKKKGEYVFLQLTDDEAHQIANKVTEFNTSIMKDCIATAQKIMKEEVAGMNVGDMTLKLAFALFDKSAIQSYSVMRSELDKPRD
jgi:hypothetical protein